MGILLIDRFVRLQDLNVYLFDQFIYLLELDF